MGIGSDTALPFPSSVRARSSNPVTPSDIDGPSEELGGTDTRGATAASEDMEMFSISPPASAPSKESNWKSCSSLSM